MIFVFYFFAALQVFLGYKSLRGGIDFLNFFKSEINRPKSEFVPFVSIIAPCRGLDEGLESNLTALFRQDFPRYEIVFAVDDERDEAVSIIEKVSREKGELREESSKFKVQSSKTGDQIENPKSNCFGGENSVSAKLIVAGKATDSSQKVHNLRRAVLEVSGESKVFVFVDSDARPNADWLRNLIAPLRNENVGAATGYRWFVAKRGGFASQLLSVWNASIASALGDERKANFCWGGSTAMRRDTFEKLGIGEKWRGTLSDDYAVTRAMKEANLPVRFVPQALTASVEDYSSSQLLEFTTRQMKITRVYAAHLWAASFVGSFLFSTIFWTGVLLLFFLTGWHFRLTLLFLSIIFTLGAAKAWIRLNAVKLVLKDYQKQLNQSFWWQITLWTISPVLFFFNDFAALFSRRIVWRGIEYQLKSPYETVIITRDKK
ncbi:MAG: glycosyltransferase family 2 protein [Acidobacteriota bacterium]|nr:glycosyltransferase family 2 protein [Acidobacteriota bacterium]